MAVWVIVQAIKRRRFAWLAFKAAKYLALHLHIDTKTKTWTVVSKRMLVPELQHRTYEDIFEILKSNPETFVTYEEKYPNGKFKKFIVETRKATK